jgi:hypoxanthine phosphoribosyltransferase
MLLVDDIADSGNSLQHVLRYIKRRYHTDNEVLIYTVFYKPSSVVVPNFYSEQVDSKYWVVFPWEEVE